MKKILLLKFLNIEVIPDLPIIDPNEVTLQELKETLIFWSCTISILIIIVIILLIIIIHKLSKKSNKE